MMENRYRKLTERIHTPAGLNDQVLFEARRRQLLVCQVLPDLVAVQSTPVNRKGYLGNILPGNLEETAGKVDWTRVLLRTAVCAVCALALVLGGFSLRPAPTAAPGTPGSTGRGGPPSAASPADALPRPTAPPPPGPQAGPCPAPRPGISLLPFLFRRSWCIKMY